MDVRKTGSLIAALRREQNMTQKELAQLLCLSDRTVSKWERGAGAPDVSLWSDLSEILGISVRDLLAGERTINPKDGGNMKRTKFYVCPHCGNILTASSAAQLTCCGAPLSPLEAKPEDSAHTISVETMDGEYYVSMQHEMSKAHYISFFACLTGDKLYLNRLYPEGDAAARFPRIGMGTLYAYCTDGGLYRKYIRRAR
ncbi:MAG TPA: helix-turn-helix domain-containing protein [Candidatus Butyricicoccus stercorigallinarum]|nr:helix-turn-helix domain-containing protein [Candidatus Butyricicoccus stercorigallinarum]